MTFTKGHSYAVTLRRPRAHSVTYTRATYLGPDPARDDVQVFWWEEQSVVLKVQGAVIEDVTELPSEAT